MSSSAQVSNDSDLFRTLAIQDSIFFERSFNLCDLPYLEDHIADNLQFYHDQSGIQDRAGFMENISKYICSGKGPKPIRKLEQGSLEVFPLYNNGDLYGAIQKGVHKFYLREAEKEDVWTSTARFTTVWIKQDEKWLMSNVLSYGHQVPDSE